MFDILSSQYGWTTEYILERTLFEINWRIKEALKRMNLERKFELAIHGIDSPDDGTPKEKAHEKLDDNQKKAMEIALERAKERKRVEFLNKG